MSQASWLTPTLVTFLDFLPHFGGLSGGFPRAPKAAQSPALAV